MEPDQPLTGKSAEVYQLILRHLLRARVERPQAEQMAYLFADSFKETETATSTNELETLVDKASREFLHRLATS